MLVLFGDVLFHTHIQRLAQCIADTDGMPLSAAYASMLRGIRPLATRGYAVANLESPIADGALGTSFVYGFSAPPAACQALRDVGIDLVSVANNHALDGGADGVRETCAHVDACGMARVGARLLSGAEHGHVAHIDGRSVCILGLTYGTNGATDTEAQLVEPADACAAVRAASATCDTLVLLLHWGIEYANAPTETQRRVAHALCNAGADVIAGAHPHVLQPVETVVATDGRRCLVLYSLGTLLSACATVETQTAAAALVDWDDEGRPCLGMVPLSVENYYWPRYGKRVFAATIIDHVGGPLSHWQHARRILGDQFLVPSEDDALATGVRCRRVLTSSFVQIECVPEVEYARANCNARSTHHADVADEDTSFTAAMDKECVSSAAIEGDDGHAIEQDDDVLIEAKHALSLQSAPFRTLACFPRFVLLHVADGAVDVTRFTAALQRVLHDHFPYLYGRVATGALRVHPDTSHVVVRSTKCATPVRPRLWTFEGRRSLFRRPFFQDDSAACEIQMVAAADCTVFAVGANHTVATSLTVADLLARTLSVTGTDEGSGVPWVDPLVGMPPAPTAWTGARNPDAPLPSSRRRMDHAGDHWSFAPGAEVCELVFVLPDTPRAARAAAVCCRLRMCAADAPSDALRCTQVINVDAVRSLPSNRACSPIVQQHIDIDAEIARGGSLDTLTQLIADWLHGVKASTRRRSHWMTSETDVSWHDGRARVRMNAQHTLPGSGAYLRMKPPEEWEALAFAHDGELRIHFGVPYTASAAVVRHLATLPGARMLGQHVFDRK